MGALRLYARNFKIRFLNSIGRPTGRDPANALWVQINEIWAKPNVRRVELLEELVHNEQIKFLQELHGFDDAALKAHVNANRARLEVEATDVLLEFRSRFTPDELSAIEARAKLWRERLYEQQLTELLP